MRVEHRSVGWSLLLWWVLASGVGWGFAPFMVFLLLAPFARLVFTALVDGATAAEVSAATYALSGAIFGIVLGALLGAVFGILQWAILRRHVPRAYGWIAASIIGLSLGSALGVVALLPMYTGPTMTDPSYLMFVALAVPGVIVGLAQRLVLRRHFDGTWWWLLPSVLTWPVTVFASDEWNGGVFDALRIAGGYGFGGVILGIISGLGLLLISRSRRGEP